ncbi:iron-containing alcohol dehydrogenase [Clostridium sp. PL3]|uniref:Iron-containing alcohol dehydrogenase n=1 Tax=Clostridium thailandense TaxID=2794346 RepID=A0A949WTV7_9CLOT|nr:alcohol dehydrogenase-like regulatory protein ErcA [Clostridium thailandense]MBV7276636.1 iron-containing alcohol dehydrogenase [Clostridium thailandense]
MYDELELKKFVVPEFIYGKDARLLAGRYAKNLGARKILIVTDPGIIKAGWVDELIDSLEAFKFKYVIFKDVSPNPRDFEVMAGAEVFNKEKCNFIISIGGGSSMDCAKGIGIVAANFRNIVDFEGVDKVTIPGPPLICIPTTSGSSADVSQFSIVLNTQKKVKIAIVSKTVVPDIALIDPVTLTTMNSYLAACTAMDAMTHAIEAYVSNAQSPISDLHAIEAISLISENILNALSNLDNIELMGKLMLGSLHAGMAFSNASLGAVHAMAHSLGGMLDLPHGECNAILLKYLVNYNFKYSEERFRNISSAMGLNLSRESNEYVLKSLTEKIELLRFGVGISSNFKSLNIDRNRIPILAENALKDVCMITNPVMPIKDEIEEIYGQVI